MVVVSLLNVFKSVFFFYYYYFYAFAERLEKVVNDTVNIGLRFHDYLCDCYYSLQLIDEEDEEKFYLK